MDITKLNGLVSAIEAESKQPSPSHQNLARLVAMFFRALIDEHTESTQEVVGTEIGKTEPPPDDEPTPTPEPERPHKPKAHKTKAK